MVVAEHRALGILTLLRNLREMTEGRASRVKRILVIRNIVVCLLLGPRIALTRRDRAPSAKDIDDRRQLRGVSQDVC